MITNQKEVKAGICPFHFTSFDMIDLLFTLL